MHPGDELIEHMHHEALQDRSVLSRKEGKCDPVIPLADLPDADPASPLQVEWATYRRVAQQLLADGHAHRFVLIKDTSLVGQWETQGQALQAGHERFPGQPFLVHQIEDSERLIRPVLPCRALPIHSRMES